MTKQFVLSDVILFTRSFHAGWTDGGGRPVDNRPYAVFRPEFEALMKTKKDFETSNHVFCEDLDGVTEAEQRRDGLRTMYEKDGYTFSVIKEWRPSSLALPAMAIQKPAPPAGQKKNEHILVRDPDARPVAKPAAKPVPKPATKPAVAVKPVPKKPNTPCGRKGQRHCRAKPM